MKSFGETLRELRIAQDLGLRETAVKAGISPAYLSRIERDKESAPRPDVIKELARLMDADRQQPPFVPMLSNGTSGDINNINFRNPRPRQSPYEQIDFVGRDVAKNVHAAMKGLSYRRDKSSHCECRSC